VVRRYEEPIEVRSAGQAREAGAADAPGAPDAFVWRGRLYVVREVLEHWQERRPWWRDALETVASGTEAGDTPACGGAEPSGVVLAGARERQVWRVEASAGRMAGTGVYDLGADLSPRQWRLLRVAD
jgi:hypothetical protein